MEVAGKTAFITGGASGIGLGIAKVLNAHGARIVLADIRQDHLDETAEWFAERQQARNIHTVQLDITERAQFKEAADQAEAVFGGIDILINNAGVDTNGPFDKLTYVDWDYGISINLMGPINGIQTVVPRMRARGAGGHVVNTASLAGMVPMPSFAAIYAAAKSGVIALTESMRDSLAQDNIGCTVLCPGPIKSRIHESALNKPERFRAGSGIDEAQAQLMQRTVSDKWMEATEVGEMVLDAIRNNKLYIVTHGEWRDVFLARMHAILEAMPTEVSEDLIATLRPK
jgi:NAD(P)-dependent dehydrogenase (short-subunit alcohol dehydrogenase family)